MPVCMRECVCDTWGGGGACSCLSVSLSVCLSACLSVSVSTCPTLRAYAARANSRFLFR